LEDIGRDGRTISFYILMKEVVMVGTGWDWFMIKYNGLGIVV
jgi:hypothetical protein